MRLRSSLFRLPGTARQSARPSIRAVLPRSARNASAAAAAEVDVDLVSSSHTIPPPANATVSSFDPVARTQGRRKQLPPSKYQFRPPRYYRGPLHPHQPPRPSDPSSREFKAGPFTLPRLEQTYQNTIAPDLMTLGYAHVPPGYEKPPKSPRLREWIGDSPYFQNRPRRGPRGASHLRLLKQPITFKQIPRLESITVHTMASRAMEDSAYLHVAGMIVQSITNVRVTTHKARVGQQTWGLRKGKFVSVTANLYGEDMYHFLSKCVDVVLPRIKDWKGIQGSSGDNSGNFTFGLTPEAVALFPEIEVNYDMYPPKMIPGCHITIKTSATTDREGRLLLTTIGLPFYGKFIN